MADEVTDPRVVRKRREPPPLRSVTVVAWEERSPRLLRLTFEGPGLRKLVVEHPAASVRLLVPSPGTTALAIPDWNGNEFLLPDGSRPALRTFTPLQVDNTTGRLDLDIVRHPGGAVSTWSETAAVGDPAAISGPGAGYEIDGGADRLLVLADETALPAATQLIETIPRPVRLEVHVEVVSDVAAVELPERPGAEIHWHVRAPTSKPGAELVAVVESLNQLTEGDRVWAAGEAASMQAIRTHLRSIGVDRALTSVRGYWKPQRR